MELSDRQIETICGAVVSVACLAFAGFLFWIYRPKD